MRCSAVGCSMMFTLSLLAAPLLAVAQPAGQMRHIGLLRAGVTSGVASMDFERNFAAFRQGLRDLGWVEGQNLTIEYRATEGHTERLPALAAELVGLPVEVIVTMGLATRAVQNATSTIPIVMGGDPHPVEAGFIASLARPGGNITGIFVHPLELAAKRIELVRESLPQARHLGLIWDASSRDQVEAAAVAAKSLNFEARRIEVTGQPPDYAAAFGQMADVPGEPIVIPSGPIFLRDRAAIGRLLLERRIPSICAFREIVEAGAVMSYGVDLVGLFRDAADVVDQIAKGAKPAELPILQSSRFHLAINLKSATALGISLPVAFTARADEVIE